MGAPGPCPACESVDLERRGFMGVFLGCHGTRSAEMITAGMITVVSNTTVVPPWSRPGKRIVRDHLHGARQVLNLVHSAIFLTMITGRPS